ncbi:MAG: PIN domain nuclease [Ekhidna sp.]
MDNVFLDTDVCLDILALRKPYYQKSIELLRLRESTQKVRLCISESSIPNLIYFTMYKYKVEDAYVKLLDWIETCSLFSIGDKDFILEALKSEFHDKEDAIQYYTAIRGKVDYFITRNKKDYEPFGSSIPIFTPSEFLAVYDK